MDTAQLFYFVTKGHITKPITMCLMNEFEVLNLWCAGLRLTINVEKPKKSESNELLDFLV